MAIITQTILSTDEYLEVYPQDANVDTDIISGSINDATITLDAICGGMIAKVWPVEDPEDPLFRTDEEKNYIKQAHAIQAHEGVCRSVDFTGGSESYTSGSNNYNQSRTTPGVVADEVIYQLLAKARVYNPNITTDTTIASNQGNFYDPTYDPSQEYITIELGDNRYIHKHAENVDYNNKFLYYDENGNITYVELSEIILDNFYTKDEIDAKLLAYITEEQVDKKLEEYYTAQTIDKMFANYYTQAQIDNKLADYYTTTQVDALLNDKQNRLTAGENITIAQVGQDLVISATTEPIGSVDFADIVGDPYDNAELGMVLNSKASASDLTTEILARSNADTQLQNTKQDKLPDIPDTTKTYTLKAVNGVITWVEEEQTPWWEETESLTSADIGTTREVEVNGQIHTVRLIGVDHDDLADGTGKAHTTWEFVNLLSDSTGHSLATVWDWQNGESSTNYDFINSNIQKALNGTGTAPFAGWYQKGATIKSTTYTTSVLEMLPEGLQNVIKSVSKVVGIGTPTGGTHEVEITNPETNEVETITVPNATYTNQTYTTKIFVLSYREMTATGTSEYQTNEGTTYEYYVQHDDYASRQKAQINNSDYYTDTPTISDGSYAAYNYAGYYNESYVGNNLYWLRSPRNDLNNIAWSVSQTGNLRNLDHLYEYARPVAPCFCI